MSENGTVSVEGRRVQATREGLYVYLPHKAPSQECINKGCPGITQATGVSRTFVPDATEGRR